MTLSRSNGIRASFQDILTVSSFSSAHRVTLWEDPKAAEVMCMQRGRGLRLRTTNKEGGWVCAS